MMNTTVQKHFSKLGLVLLTLLIGFPMAFGITPSAYEHYQRGVMQETKNDLKGAELSYRTVLALDPYDGLVYVRLASVVERLGYRDEALQLYQKALALNPKDTMLHLSIAQLWEAKNKPLKALEHYQQLLTSHPDYTYAHLSAARLQKTLNNSAESVKHYQAFLKAYPKHYDAQRELASLLMTEKQYTQAAETYKTLKSTNEAKFRDDLAYGVALNNADKAQEALSVFDQIQTPSVVLYEQKGIAYEKLNRLPEAYDAYQQAVSMAASEKFALYLKMADIASTLNQPQQAMAALKNYLTYDPQNGHVSKSLGDLYLQQKDFESAIPLYKTASQALTDKSALNEVLRNLAYAQQMKGQLDQAIITYEQSLNAEENHQARLNLALAYHQQGNYTKALELYRRLLVADPNSLTLRKDMGQVLLALGDQTYKGKDYKAAMNYYQDAFLLGDEAEVPALLGIANTQYALKNHQMAYTTYQRVLEKNPENLVARINKAQLDLDQKNYMAALENLRWVVQQKPDYFEAYRLLAQAHEGLGDYGQAVIYYRKALEISPQDSVLLIGYGNVWRHVGDLDRAQKAYEMARTQSPENAMIRYNLASVYNLKNQYEASLAEYKAALELNPSFAEPYYGMGLTLEKQKKFQEALTVYQQYLQKAPSSSTYVPVAKERIELLKKSISPQSSTSASQKSSKP